MKRILFVDHTPIVGGAQLALAEHIAHLDRSRYTPLVACTADVPSLAERYRAEGAEVFFVPLRRLKTLAPAVVPRFAHAAWRLRRLIREQRVDLVVANTSRAAYVAALAVTGTRARLIWYVRDFLFQRRLFRWLAWVPVKIICVSRAIKNFYDDSENDRYAVVYVGSSLYRRLAEVSPEALEAERARWGIGPRDVVVGFMGRVVEDKGPQDVVEAVRRLHPRFPHLRLLVVGTGKNQEGDNEAELRRRVEEAGLGGVVTFTGHQFDEAKYYQLFDIYVLSTRTPEPFATTVVQAMMAGTPVIGTASGGTPEIIRDHENGLLVPPASPEAMAEAIRELLEDPELGERLAAEAREFVLQHNREEVITAQVERLYEAVA